MKFLYDMTFGQNLAFTPFNYLKAYDTLIFWS